MLLRDLKSEFLIPDKEIIINKAFRARGQDGVLASLTLQDGKQTLWSVCRSSIRDACDVKCELTTNRDIFRCGMDAAPGMFPCEARIQGHKITFGGGRSRAVFPENVGGYMRLQHFAEQKVDLSVFDGTDLIHVMIMAWEVNGEVPFSEISPPFDGDIVLKIREIVRQQYIGRTYDLPFGVALPDERRSFFDNENNVERYFYINRLARYDPRGSMQATGENTCPSGFGLAYVEYEAEDDIQFLFYEKEYLDSAPERAGRTIGIYGSTTEKGPHGLKLQTCVLKKPVPKDFDGHISIELFSRDIRVPEETIVI
ncbi:hypothetical protein SAMN02745823_02189 [Sporobacter termitidis DSM 10068]|uniref:Uncharacterized protein n=2 Tax=Sporobacter TaxID=44748 RepID=A0A1M5Y3H7_9FIRM|nr:hypothetical protein SAMN02745823_02189 [Sporobacter termitidis DSM 10068]